MEVLYKTLDIQQAHTHIHICQNHLKCKGTHFKTNSSQHMKQQNSYGCSRKPTLKLGMDLGGGPRGPGLPLGPVIIYFIFTVGPLSKTLGSPSPQ